MDARAAPLCYAVRTSPPWHVGGLGASGTPEPKFLMRREMETEAGEGTRPAERPAAELGPTRRRPWPRRCLWRSARGARGGEEGASGLGPHLPCPSLCPWAGQTASGSPLGPMGPSPLHHSEGGRQAAGQVSSSTYFVTVPCSL